MSHQHHESDKNRGRYGPLLLGLIVLFITGALLKDFEHIRFVVGLIMVSVLIGSIRAISGSRKYILAAYLMTILAAGLEALYAYTERQLYIELAFAVEGPFFFLITTVLLGRLLREKEISDDTILGAVCVYFLIGVAWSFIYLGIEVSLPGSFSITTNNNPGIFSEELRGSMIYYSLITLTTVGYGDIFPLHSVPRIFAALEAVIGQMYIAILVARMVAIQVTIKLGNK